ncbi:OLC1v1038779C1 [Oldenlandia corymbosa var. corymbosa]|uniref:OLC1v1038779C1 n=1 Tax=Oldenlandia corymbosa var. corymbosa TaxID=529605 RepID=A0AAV1D0J8_OLDCO|nr:OLC1v1038779C1 [Oldenlandia corymbosa var. corymbosa]
MDSRKMMVFRDCKDTSAHIWIPFTRSETMQIEASSKEGILCIRVDKFPNRTYYIGKPTSDQWFALPNHKPIDQFLTEQVCLVVLNSDPLTFKRVTLSPKCGANRATNYYGSRCDNESLVVNGLVHWLTTDGRAIVFDHEHETYQKEVKQLWVVDDSGHTNKWCLIEQQNQDFTSNGILVDPETKVMKFGGFCAQHVFPFTSNFQPIRLECNKNPCRFLHPGLPKRQNNSYDCPSRNKFTYIRDAAVNQPDGVNNVNVVVGS